LQQREHVLLLSETQILIGLSGFPCPQPVRPTGRTWLAFQSRWPQRIAEAAQD
jgi:hypothetical protein